MMKVVWIGTFGNKCNVGGFSGGQMEWRVYIVRNKWG